MAYLPPDQRRIKMEPEKEIEVSEELEIIDAGLELEEIIDSQFYCCWCAFMPFRW